jgi:hypothetical protein
VSARNPAAILHEPFDAWPSELRSAFLEGWAVEKLGYGKSGRVLGAGYSNVQAIVIRAAWELGRTEAAGQGRAA